MKYVFILTVVALLLSSCDDKKDKNIDEEPEYLTEEDYNIQFDTLAHNFLYERYRVYEDQISRCAVESKFSDVLKTKLKVLMWRHGKVLYNSLDSASNTRELMLMDSKFYKFQVRAFNNSHTASIKGWDSIKIHGEMVGFLYDKVEEDIAALSTPTFIALIDSIKIIERNKPKNDEK